MPQSWPRCCSACTSPWPVGGCDRWLSRSIARMQGRTGRWERIRAHTLCCLCARLLKQPWQGDPSGMGNPPVRCTAPGAADCSPGKDGRTAVEPLHTQSSVARRTTCGCSEVIFGSLLRTVGIGGTGGLLQGARAGPLHWESRSHPLLHLWRVQKLFSVISGLELTAKPFLSAMAAWLGERLPGRSEHAPGAAGSVFPAPASPARAVLPQPPHAPCAPAAGGRPRTGHGTFPGSRTAQATWPQ